MKRVAYFLRSSAFGGAEHNLLTLLERLDRRRFKPVVYWYGINADVDRRMRQELAARQVPVRSLDQDSVPLLSSTPIAAEFGVTPHSALRGVLKRLVGSALPRSVKLLAYYRRRIALATKRLQEERLEIIHFLAGGYPSFIIPMIASRRAGIPVRIADVLLDPRSVRSADLGWARGLIAWWAGQSMTRVRAMSRRMKEQLQRQWGIPSKKITVIGNWVDVSRFGGLNGAAQLRAQLGLADDTQVVAVVARLSREKGHMLLLEAAARLRSRYPRARYLLVGDGPLRDELTRSVQRFGLEDAVRLLGFREDVPCILAASDLVMLPSLVEGVPAAVLEAMAAGKPVIATDVGGVREVVKDTLLGRVVEPGNVGALAGALEELLGADERRLSWMGQQARRHVMAHYHIDTILAKIWSLYDAPASSKTNQNAEFGMRNAESSDDTLRIPNSALRTAYNSKMAIEGSQE